MTSHGAATGLKTWVLLMEFVNSSQLILMYMYITNKQSPLQLTHALDDTWVLQKYQLQLSLEDNLQNPKKELKERWAKPQTSFYLLLTIYTYIKKKKKLSPYTYVWSIGCLYSKEIVKVRSLRLQSEERNLQ